ncbi:mersacidin/lichenicidin family type 2 lantibiotic [Micromonospora vulcania]|uniref:Mersacidin/lichenicidin family type 2 lantibiotic n=1 Tax=Micromonospora vulcania TaxID=1441873 RepID=A0ABW1H3F0_9ACTN
MNTTTRAWKDPVFRATLEDAEFAALPVHPAGAVEFETITLDETRGAGSEANMTVGCCNTIPATFRTCLTCAQWTCRTCWGC